MPDDTRELVVLMTRGADHELSSVGFTIACGALTAGMAVCAFLTSSAVDLVRRRAVETTQVQPLDPLKTLLTDFMSRGGQVIACRPCAEARGYALGDLLEGVTIAGANVMHQRLKAGAASLSF